MDTPNVPILLVDDRRANLAALEAVFESQPYDLVGVTSGEDALDQVERREFAVILLDLQMPGMDGIETATEMRKRAAGLGIRVPIIFVSAVDVDRARHLEAYEAGAVDVIQKPLEPAILRAKVAVFADLYRYRLVASHRRHHVLGKTASHVDWIFARVTRGAGPPIREQPRYPPSARSRMSSPASSAKGAPPPASTMSTSRVCTTSRPLPTASRSW